MKLEFLPDGSTDCPLIRLFDFTQKEAAWLHGLLVNLSTGLLQSVALHDHPNVEAIGHCELNLRCGQSYRGVMQIEPWVFDCVLTPVGWDNMAGLVAPFCDDATTGFQWLCGKTRIKLLLTKDGHW